MTVAENLARARSESGLGQEDVANALGVSRAMVGCCGRPSPCSSVRRRSLRLPMSPRC
jgi:transcriptional regulator with XRE-family HTH domain